MSRIVGMLLVLLLSTPAAAETVQWELPLMTERWSKVEGDHFVLYGNGEPKALSKLALELEQFRAVVLSALPIESGLIDERITVFAFKDRDTLARYPLSNRGPGMLTLGLAYTTSSRGWLQMVSPRSRAAESVGFHEYTHYLTVRNAGSLPAWLTEGLADYYGAFQVRKDGRALLGAPVVDHVRFLRQKNLLEMDRLLPARSGHSSDVRLTQNIYAQGWGLVHYINHAQPDWAVHLPEYLRRIAAGADAFAAFEPTFGVSASAVQAALKEYAVRADFKQVALRVEGGLPTELRPAVAVSPLEAGVALADIRLAMGMQGGATSEVLRILKKRSPDDPRVTALQAQSEHAAGRHAEAEVLFDEALAAAPNDALALRYGSAAAYARYRASEKSPELAARTRELSAKLLDLEPWDVEAALRFGALALEERTGVEDAMVRLQTAWKARPRTPSAASLAAMLFVRLGQLDDAWTVYVQAVRGIDPPAAQAGALSLLQYEEMVRIHAWKKEGRDTEVTVRCEQLRRWGGLSRGREDLQSACAPGTR